MPADINTSMGVTGLSGYKKAMSEAKESVKTLDAELKLNEEQLKLNGNAELYMANKAALLKKQIEEQGKVASNAQKALDEMRKKGVEESSKSFQKMQQEVWNAATRLTTMKTELQQVESGAEGAKKETAGMNTELKQIGKGISWQNVTEGLHKVTESMKNGAQAAVNFGKKIARSAMDSTAWADDVLTRATKYGVDAETVQRMDNVAEFIDTDVDTIIAAQARLAKNKDNLGDLLGLDVNGKTVDEAFWEAGRAIGAMTDEWEREEAAQKVFGRGWKELLPLFTAGQEKYNQLMQEQTVMSNENVQKLGEADDAIKSIEQQVQLMKNQFWADNADKIIELLQWIIDNKDGIVTALTVIAGGFGLLKMGEFALNVGQAVNGMKELIGLGGGGGTGAAGAGKAVAGAAAKTGIGAAAKTALASAGMPLLMLGLGIAPSLIAMNQTWAASEEKRAGRAATAATSNSANAQFLAKAAEALVLRAGENADFQGIRDLLMGLEARQNQERAELHNIIQKYAPTTSDGNYTWNQLLRYWESGGGMDAASADALLESITNAMEAAVAAEGAPKVEVDPEVPENATSIISEQIGIVPIKVTPQMGSGIFSRLLGVGFANGIPFVPADGMLSILHKGERVLTARENRNYTYNSNTYFGNVNLNNGLEVDALAKSIARENKRKNRGFG